MVKEYFKNFMLSRFHIFLFTISSIVMGVELDSGSLKITNLDRLIFTKNGEFTI